MNEALRKKEILGAGMEILSTIEVGEHVIDFGVATTEEERDEIMRQRFRIYKTEGYYKAGIEKDEDEYDRDATFFMGRLHDKASGKSLIVGSVRLISGKETPGFLFSAQKAHEFELPAAVKEIPIIERAELGRLVAERPQGIFMGRLSISLGLLHAAIEYSYRKNLRCGVSTIKHRLLGALEAADIHFHEIPFTRIIYPPDGIIADYYYTHSDPSVPVYYLRDEVAPAVKRAVNMLNSSKVQ